MPATDERYPALVERALRLIEERGEPVAAEELCRELFGASGGRWVGLLGRVLSSDGRLRALPGGRWGSSFLDTPAAAQPDVGAGARTGSTSPGVREDATASPIGPAGPRPRHVLARPPGRRPASKRLPEGGAARRERGAAGGPLASATLSPVGLVVLATGPKPWRHPIVAVGAARRRPDGALERWGTLVRPPAEGGRAVRVPAYLSGYGVVASELDEAPTPDRAIDELIDFVGAAPLAGLDVALAVARLQFALRQLGRPPLDNPTIELSVPGERKPDLARLARSAGLPVPPRPTPASLAGLAVELTERSAVGRRPGSALGATAWRRLLDAGLLGCVPERPGVYRFQGADGRLLYVGKATSLRSRLASYLTGSFPLIRQMPGLVEATDRLAWDQLSCELAARLREAELIAAERPTYNVQRRAGRALVRARLRLAGDPDPTGRRVPRLELDELAGTLTTAAAAQMALRRARAAWWPPRPRAGARPAPPAVLERLESLAAAVAAELRLAEVGPGLRAADLDRLVVVAPTRPTRSATTVERDPDEAEWTRERRDLAWPPRELLDELTEPLEPISPPEEPPAEAAASALLVDPGGVRAVAELDDLPNDQPALRARAVAALASQPRREAAPEPVGMAVLATLLAALARREPGVRAWALGAEELA